ncbi:MAG: tRNA (5-methylaminomethyl-2-thiouridine)(34)-methyltransferase MnmD [Bacteroidales bacterium]|nr:tRNA (5-methylaminomethyl-2-thiouridine)(34)-methyltransferase MnmD [Bacteroidales bacterium]
MIDYHRRELIITEDGSSSLKLNDIDEQYHSIHGAINESTHIYINAGLLQLTKMHEIHILEAGFGTGLNALLTLQNAGNQIIHYDTIEAFPLSMDEVVQLNYAKNLDKKLQSQYYAMHACPHDTIQLFGTQFFFLKWLNNIQDISLPPITYDLVYFDMFGPAVQPDLWNEMIFKKIFEAMKNDSFLITYCAKGSVKRTLKSVGFDLESLPGPIGKREITKAIKK